MLQSLLNTWAILFALNLCHPVPFVGGEQPPVPEPAKPRVLNNDAVNVPYIGSVIAVPPSAITIQWPGETAPKAFAVSNTLASGKIPSDPRPSPTRLKPYPVADQDKYRLTDVKVGDVVMIHYAHLGNVDI